MHFYSDFWKIPGAHQYKIIEELLQRNPGWIYWEASEVDHGIFSESFSVSLKRTPERSSIKNPKTIPTHNPEKISHEAWGKSSGSTVIIRDHQRRFSKIIWEKFYHGMFWKTSCRFLRIPAFRKKDLSGIFQKNFRMILH